MMNYIIQPSHVLLTMKTGSEFFNRTQNRPQLMQDSRHGHLLADVEASRFPVTV